eukprot:537996_1
MIESKNNVFKYVHVSRSIHPNGKCICSHIEKPRIYQFKYKLHVLTSGCNGRKMVYQGILAAYKKNERISINNEISKITKEYKNTIGSKLLDILAYDIFIHSNKL